MNSSPLVSIITVVFNGEKYLSQTIESVLEQTYHNIEYIIVDGGSTDNTISIIKGYEKILQWVSEPDKGLYDAMNKGIALANGELIGMINSDDWYEPFAVQTMVDAYLVNPDKNIFHADRFDITENGEKLVRKFNTSKFKFKYYAMTFNHPSMFVTKKEYAKHRYNSDLKSLSDYQFVMEAFLKNANNFFYIEHPIVNYRLDGISANRNMWDGTIEGYKVRKAAGLNLVQRLWAIVFGTTVTFILRIKRRIL